MNFKYLSSFRLAEQIFLKKKSEKHNFNNNF